MPTERSDAERMEAVRRIMYEWDRTRFPPADYLRRIREAVGEGEVRQERRYRLYRSGTGRPPQPAGEDAITAEEARLVREEAEVILRSYEWAGHPPEEQVEEWHEGQKLLRLAEKLDRLAARPGEASEPAEPGEGRKGDG